MAKVRFGERSGDYIQEVEMDKIVTKCDACLVEMEKSEKISLFATLYTGKKEDGVRPIIFNIKDICSSCSYELAAFLTNFIKEKNNE